MQNRFERSGDVMQKLIFLFAKSIGQIIGPMDNRSVEDRSERCVGRKLQVNTVLGIYGFNIASSSSSVGNRLSDFFE